MTGPSDLLPVLFETNPGRIARALEAGISHFIVDWEWNGKERRQRDFDTEINRQTVKDLESVASIPGTTAWCRINAPGPWTPGEVETAVAAGASVLLLPMVRSAGDVEAFLRLVDRRCRAGILIETEEACRRAAEIAGFPLDAVYVGLNDLMISLENPSIFTALASGLVDAVRSRFHVPLFGLGGATVLDRGTPLPCRVFLQEMSRLQCNMTFLRRSYRRDIAGRDPAAEMRDLRAYWRELAGRSSDELAVDHRKFRELVNCIDQDSARRREDRVVLRD